MTTPLFSRCIQVGPPGTRQVELHDLPDTRAFREAIKAVGSELDPERLYALITSAEETAANALVYGIPPVTAGAWAEGGLLVVVVHDHGSVAFDEGPALQIMRKLVDHASVSVSPHGTTFVLGQHSERPKPRTAAGPS